jgi:hypothetical protein
MLHRNKFSDKLKLPTTLMERTMFTFEEQYKKFEELNSRTKQAYDFWYSCLISTWEDFFKVKKSK